MEDNHTIATNVINNWDDIFKSMTDQMPPMDHMKSILEKQESPITSYKRTTIFSGGTQNKRPDPPVAWPSINKIGWECPRCHAVNSPSIERCTCEKQKNINGCFETGCKKEADFYISYNKDSFIKIYGCTEHIGTILTRLAKIAEQSVTTVTYLK